MDKGYDLSIGQRRSRADNSIDGELGGGIRRIATHGVKLREQFLDGSFRASATYDGQETESKTSFFHTSSRTFSHREPRFEMWQNAAACRRTKSARAAKCRTSIRDQLTHDGRMKKLICSTFSIILTGLCVLGLSARAALVAPAGNNLVVFDSDLNVFWTQDANLFHTQANSYNGGAAAFVTAVINASGGTINDTPN
ncbi:MAG TPA: hypothetical protein VHH73_09855, partial [Verrucomicrobiae bacterium]|nr:hypothetical protein [Verrucomicrobiae bacterium]